jgi:hypothetical protein
MKRYLVTLCSAAALILSTFLFVGSASAETCFNCAKDSTSSCSGKQQCRGNRADCRKKGCKITGTSSCSSAVNVKKCDAPLVPEHDSFASFPAAETCFSCAKDSTSSCSGKQQCRGNRADCRKKGCKITGTSSCSSSVNVKKCDAPLVPEHDSFASFPAAETCLMCAGDSTGGCAGAKQCRGSRKDCRSRGCKITGTASCSKAANVKICKSHEGQTAQAQVSWCSY